MRTVALAVCCTFGFTHCASAGDDAWTSRRGLATVPGQPFCTDRDDLQDFLMASAAADDDRLSSLDGCSTFRDALSATVVKTYPDSAVLKIRVYVGNGSVVAYTLTTSVAPR